MIILGNNVVHAKDAPTQFLLKRIKDLPDIEGELEVGLPVLVTFTISWYNWNAADDGDAPDNPSSPSKKQKDGYSKAVSFNIHEVVHLSTCPATGDDISYDADSEEDVFV